MKKLIKESEVESCNKKIELYQVEELEGRFELAPWLNLEINAGCVPDMPGRLAD